jgi:hypothetical protein
MSVSSEHTALVASQASSDGEPPQEEAKVYHDWSTQTLMKLYTSGSLVPATMVPGKQGFMLAQFPGELDWIETEFMVPVLKRPASSSKQRSATHHKKIKAESEPADSEHGAGDGTEEKGEEEEPEVDTPLEVFPDTEPEGDLTPDQLQGDAAAGHQKPYVQYRKVNAQKPARSYIQGMQAGRWRLLVEVSQVRSASYMEIIEKILKLCQEQSLNKEACLELRDVFCNEVRASSIESDPPAQVQALDKPIIWPKIR